jgi:4-amino-4-deoxy-L-arabinose transferase-like glycosyltransferase
MITPDTGATALGAASCYLFWKWLRQPTWGWAIAAGITLGLAELCKMSWIILFVLWPLTWVAWQLTWFRERETRWGEQIRQLGLALTLAVLLINLGYGFEETGRPLGSFRFFSAALKGVDPHTNGEAVESHWVQLSPGNRFQGTWAAAIPILLPSNYVAGIDNQRLDFEQGYRSYLRGEWRHGGWWYYYLYGLAVKWPIGTWVVLVLAAGLWILRFPFGPGLRNELILLAPAITLLVLVSSQTGFNHHLRYILPIFPILFIWAGRTVMPGTATYLKATAWLAVTAAAVSSLAVYPHSMSYFNELAGGPERGHEHLLDSNMDWGQDLLYLKRWLDEHPEAQALGLAFFGRFDPNAAGIEFTLPPVLPPSPDEWAGLPLDQLGPRPGWYAVSVNLMHGAHVRVSAGGGKSVNLEEGFFEYFRWFKPVARAGYSIYIYHLDYDECNRVRADHGLTLLERVDSPYLLP